MMVSNRNLLFQGFIFRCYVTCRKSMEIFRGFGRRLTVQRFFGTFQGAPSRCGCPNIQVAACRAGQRFGDNCFVMSFLEDFHREKVKNTKFKKTQSFYKGDPRSFPDKNRSNLKKKGGKYTRMLVVNGCFNWMMNQISTWEIVGFPSIKNVLFGEKLTFLLLPFGIFVFIDSGGGGDSSCASYSGPLTGRKWTKVPQKGKPFWKKNIPHLPVPWIFRGYVSYFFGGRIIFSEAVNIFYLDFWTFRVAMGAQLAHTWKINPALTWDVFQTAT